MCKINSNVAMVLNVPVSSTAQVTGIGWGATGGVGYNLNSRHAIIGEFLWNRMYPSGGVLLPLQATTPQLGNLDRNSNLYALTGNHRRRISSPTPPRRLSHWWRRLVLPEELAFTGHYCRAPATVCTPAWLWWGFKSLVRNRNSQSDAGNGGTANAWGVNAGVGFTVRVGDCTDFTRRRAITMPQRKTLARSLLR